MRRALCHLDDGARALLQFPDRADPVAKLVVRSERHQPFTDGDRHLVGIERALDGKEPVALLVLLADDLRLARATIKLLAHLHFDQRALLLDHHHCFEAVDEIEQTLGVERPGAGDLVKAETDLVGLDLVYAKAFERLAHIEIALADRDDAEARGAAAGKDDLVELVGAHEGDGCLALIFVHPLFLHQEVELGPDIEPVRRHHEVLRQDDLQALGVRFDACGRLDVVLDALHRRPGAGKAAEREPVKPVIEDFLHAGGIEDRDHRIDEMKLGLMRIGRGFGGMVVAHQGQHAAMLRGAGKIGVTEDIAGTVDAGALAVPDGKDAVILALAEHLGLLRAPAGGRGKLLVEAGLEDDVGALKLLFRPEELLVEPTERRATIAGDEPCRIEARLPVAPGLHHQHADDRLRARDEHPAFREIEFVVERYVRKRDLERTTVWRLHGDLPATAKDRSFGLFRYRRVTRPLGLASLWQ